MPKSGDKCEKCGKGRLYVRTSQRIGDSQVQYLRCDNGECDCSKKVIALRESVRPRIFG